MALAQAEFQQIEAFLYETFPGIFASQDSPGLSARYEIDLRERIVRVEEELRNQRELMQEQFRLSEKRFEDMHKYMDKRFEDIEWTLSSILCNPDPPSECHLRRCIPPHCLATHTEYASGPGAFAPCI